jgi:hypothetical protein
VLLVRSCAGEGSLSAIKRLCLRLRANDGIDVAILVETEPGEIAQVAAQHPSPGRVPVCHLLRLDYVAIKSILAKVLDLEPLPSAIVPTGAGLERPRFARTIQGTDQTCLAPAGVKHGIRDVGQALV